LDPPARASAEFYLPVALEMMPTAHCSNAESGRYIRQRSSQRRGAIQ
jgi:hypothetical protein